MLDKNAIDAAHRIQDRGYVNEAEAALVARVLLEADEQIENLRQLGPALQAWIGRAEKAEADLRSCQAAFADMRERMEDEHEARQKAEAKVLRQIVALAKSNDENRNQFRECVNLQNAVRVHAEDRQKAVAELASLRETVERKQAEHDYTTQQANVISRELMQLRAKVAAAVEDIRQAQRPNNTFDAVAILVRHGLADGAP